MRLELAERLQCPGDHRPTPLVVVAAAVIDRDLRRGTAGCMQCGFQARVQDGDLWLPSQAGRPVGPSSTRASGAVSPDAPAAPAPSPEAIDRLQALLGLAESGGAVLLGGRYAAYAAGLQARLDLMVMVLDPEDGALSSVARVVGRRDVVPFTDATFRAAALEDPVLLAAAVRTVRPSGRLVAPIGCACPEAVTRLASDATEWVGERGSAPVVVPLQRAGPPRPEDRLGG